MRRSLRRVALLATMLLALITLGAGTASANSLMRLENVMNNKCLEIYGFHNENGAYAGMWDCWPGANQHWEWNGEELRNSMNGKCLEILGFHDEDGAGVGMWDCWGGANQHWYTEGGQIKSRFNNKCLEIYGFHDENGARAGAWNCWGGANQQWRQIFI